MQWRDRWEENVFFRTQPRDSNKVFFLPSFLPTLPRSSLSEISPNLDSFLQGDSRLAGAGKPDRLLSWEEARACRRPTSHVPDSRTEPGFDRADSAGQWRGGRAEGAWCPSALFFRARIALSSRVIIVSHAHNKRLPARADPCMWDGIPWHPERQAPPARDAVCTLCTHSTLGKGPGPVCTSSAERPV